MAWQDELTPTLRVMIGDLDESNETYTDDTLQQTLVVGAKQVIASLYFPQLYSASAAAVSITPDPTIPPYDNPSFVNLVTLKAAAILDRTEASLYARQGLVVKDGSSAIDLSKVGENKIALLEQGWNAVYEEEKFNYLYRRSSEAVGAMVLGPFRLFAWETYGTSGMLEGDPRLNSNMFG